MFLFTIAALGLVLTIVAAPIVMVALMVFRARHPVVVEPVIIERRRAVEVKRYPPVGRRPLEA